MLKNKILKIGIKVVRGAYMEKENDRAVEKGYPTPICSSKAATDSNFNAVVAYMLDNIEVMSIFSGTHNEKSCYKLMDLMQEKGITSNDTRIWFGQLYGMSDHITFNLSAIGYICSKVLALRSCKRCYAIFNKKG